MSSLHDKNRPYQTAFYTARGEAIHQLLALLLDGTPWPSLKQLKPKPMQALLQNLAIQKGADASLRFLRAHPDQWPWFVGCARTLLKCFDDWDMSPLILVEPTLPTLALPHGGALCFGCPDFHGYSAALGGRVSIEFKTGWHRVRRQSAKLARYNGGTRLFVQDEKGFTEPFKGTIWLSLSDCLIDPRTGKHLARPWPVLNYHFEPYCPERITRILSPRFGVGANDLARLPRLEHYDRFSSA